MFNYEKNFSNLWHGFKAVVILIENNRDWLDMLMETTHFVFPNILFYQELDRIDVIR